MAVKTKQQIIDDATALIPDNTNHEVSPADVRQRIIDIVDSTLFGDDLPAFANVATSGSYNDLIDKPTYATVATSGSYNDLTDKPVYANVAITGQYVDLINRPSLATVATSGSYNDLTNRPTLGTAALANANTFATAAQGAKADTAVQPGDPETVPAGGTTGQVLVKNSNSDYDYGWTSKPDGDMLASVYDPNGVAADAFDMDNMVEGASHKIMTAAERADIAANKSARHTHSNKSVLDATEQAFTTSLKNKLDGIAAGADVTNASTVGTAIHGSSAKATPTDADTVALIDSAASNALKKVSWANIKTTLKSYFDTLYAAVGHSHSNATTAAAGFMSATDKSKLNGIEPGAQVNAVTSVAGKTGAVTLSASDISGLGTAATSNTSDFASSSTTITAGTGLTGGGSFEANRTIALNSASIASLAKADSAVQNVNGKSGNSVTLNKSDVGLGNVDNTSDADKPISTATQTALNNKANSSVNISAGTGLTGGGNLTANRTIALNSSSIASLAKADSAVQPSDLGDLASKDKVEVSDIDASGPPSNTTFLRGDGTWSVPSGGGGSDGDMLASVYDPNGVSGDAFDMDNMSEGLANKILTAAERAKIADVDGKVSKAGDTMTGKLVLAEPTTSDASLHLPNGESPTTLDNGDLWFNGTTLSLHVSGISRSIYHTGNLPTVQQAEAEAGTATTARVWTAERVNQAIQALSPVKSVNSKVGDVVLSASDIGGLGTAATRNVGTTSGTVAAGDDSRITGAVQKAGDTGLGGFAVSGKSLGNLSGSLTPTHVGGNYQAGTITGALTINAPTAPGVYDLKIELLIGAGAGPVTLAGFDNTDFGEAFTTTEGDFFILQIEKGATRTIATVRKPT